MSDEHCFGCGTELLEIDKDPNGDLNVTCKRCMAEEDHDFDAEPGAVFGRAGERIDHPKMWRPTATPVKKPERLLVGVDTLREWASACRAADTESGACGVHRIATEIDAMIAAFQERQDKRKNRK